MTLPLEGIRVLDLSAYLPGPFCTVILADMGAEVVIIERPEHGWPERDPLGPLLATPEEEQRSSAYDFFARNKKSLTLNLKLDRAKEVFYKLVTDVDVIVDGSRPGTTGRLGIDYETVSELNPRVVYCAITGSGQDGPYRDIPGYDTNFCALSGVNSVTLDSEGNPVLLGVPLADVGSSLHAVIGILCALRARDKTGVGQFVDISITESVLSFFSLNIGYYFKDGVFFDKGPCAWRNLWPTSDGKFICTSNVAPYFWERFCQALGREDLIPYQWAGGEKLEEVTSEIRKVTATKTREEWLYILRQADTCVSPMLDVSEVVSDPQLLHRDMILELNHPIHGKVKQLGMPIKLSKTPARFRNFAPVLGQDTEGILTGLGYTAQQIEQMRNEGVIR